MKFYNMTRPAKYCRAKFSCTIVYHILVVCYHAHCSIAYLACCAHMGGIVTSCTVRSKNARTRKRVGHGRERDRSGGTGKVSTLMDSM